jgi:hypothetical protein
MKQIKALLQHSRSGNDRQSVGRGSSAASTGDSPSPSRTQPSMTVSEPAQHVKPEAYAAPAPSQAMQAEAGSAGCVLPSSH